MRKIFSFFMCFALAAVCLTGCGKKKTAEPETLFQTPQSDPALVSACGAVGFDADSLLCGQMILVRSDGTDAAIDCYERKDGAFLPVEGLSGMTGFVGKNGVNADKREGDGCTPKGLFTLSYAFGAAEKPETLLDYRQVSENSWFVDDMESMYYNQYIETDDISLFKSAEHLIDYPEQYKYAVVIEYNTSPVIPGNGSAIFLHCGSRPTAGCVCTAEENVLAVMKWLDPEKAPGIVII